MQTIHAALNKMNIKAMALHIDANILDHRSLASSLKYDAQVRQINRITKVNIIIISRLSPNILHSTSALLREMLC